MFDRYLALRVELLEVELLAAEPLSVEIVCLSK